MNDSLIYVSIAEADYLNLANEIDQVLLAGSDVIHLDIANSQKLAVQFGLSFGNVLREYIKKSLISVDVKAAIDHSDLHNLVEAGIDYISFRPEILDNASATIEMMKANGCEVGLTLDADSEVNKYSVLLEQLDFITIYLDERSATGSCISSEDLERVSYIRGIVTERQSDLSICVAGRITPENVSALVRLDVKRFVIGQTLFESHDYYTTISKLKMAIRSCEEYREAQG